MSRILAWLEKLAKDLQEQERDADAGDVAYERHAQLRDDMSAMRLRLDSVNRMLRELVGRPSLDAKTYETVNRGGGVVETLEARVTDLPTATSARVRPARRS